MKLNFCSTRERAILNGLLMSYLNPLKSRIIRPNQPPSMNSALRKAAHRKAQPENKKKHFPNNINFEKFRVQRNKTTSIRRKAIKHFYNEN